MALIPLPDGGASVKFRNAAMRFVRADGVIEFFNGATQITRGAKAVWGASFSLPPLHDEAIAREWETALVELADLENWFELTPFGYVGPSTGYAGANPKIAGAGQLGNTLNLDTLPISTAIAKRGDWFSFLAGGDIEIKKLTADLTSDVAGLATATFKGPIRKSPADNDFLEIQAPVGRFMLASSNAEWSIDLLKNRGVSLTVVESFGQ